MFISVCAYVTACMCSTIFKTLFNFKYDSMWYHSSHSLLPSDRCCV